MKAVKIKTFSEQPILELDELAKTNPESLEVKVQIKAAGVNQADLLQAKGKYPAPSGYPQDIPGLEFAGVITELGQAVDKLKVVDRVFGLTGGGAYAEELVIHWQCVSKIPDNISFIEAAALPEVLITAYDALITQMKLSMGETLLISAIGSGVGLAALQIAKNMGVTVIGSSRTKEKLSKAQSFGLDHSLCVEGGRFSAPVKEICPSGVNVVLELVGGDYFNEDIESAAVQGRIILVGLLAGRTTNIDLGKILTKRLLVKGTTLRARPLAEKILANQILEKNLVPLIEAGKLQPIIDEIFPLKEATQALEYLASNKSFGKIVLTCE